MWIHPPPKKNPQKTTAQNSVPANVSFPRRCSNSCWTTSTGLLVHQPVNEHNFIFPENSEITQDFTQISLTTLVMVSLSCALVHGDLVIFYNKHKTSPFNKNSPTIEPIVNLQTPQNNLVAAQHNTVGGFK